MRVEVLPLFRKQDKLRVGWYVKLKFSRQNRLAVPVLSKLFLSSLSLGFGK